MLKLVTPGMPPVDAAARVADPAVPMHCRFEINFVVERIIGRRPVVRILEIAWQDKREHIGHFLRDYYARHHRLPSGRHDLGRSPAFGLVVGTIDFGEVRRLVREDCQGRPRGWPRRLLSALLR